MGKRRDTCTMGLFDWAPEVIVDAFDPARVGGRFDKFIMTAASVGLESTWRIGPASALACLMKPPSPSWPRRAARMRLRISRPRPTGVIRDLPKRRHRVRLDHLHYRLKSAPKAG